jgi:23S rRNA (cytosine1962-C5)-methyltransferase
MTDDGPLDGLPRPSGRNLAVRITKDAGRHVRSGHPWIFADAVTSVRCGDGGAERARAGDLAVVFDDDRRFMAVGLWDPASPIRIKVLHHGRPETVDGAFWTKRLADAVARRGPLVSSTETTACRLVHGENDGLPGVVVDHYGDTAVLKLYTAAWFPHLAALLDALVDVVGPATVVLRLARSVQGGETLGLADGAVLRGPTPDGPVPFREHGLRFTADVLRGQKTGWFLDQRDNRALVGQRCRGARVLDVFCCTGGFSVHAAAGGATEVHSVDLSRHAVAATAHHLVLNRDRPAVAACRARSTVGDAFAVMEDLARAGERHDVVVVDPPSFASKQSDVAGALRAYQRLTTLAVALVRPGGLLFQASCSSRVGAERFLEAVQRGAAGAGVDLRVEATTGQGVDHPVGFPEGAYLCAVLATVD